MTFEEAKELLKLIRTTKYKALDIVREIEECRNSIEALSLPSVLGGQLHVDGGEPDSIEQRIVAKIEARQERLTKLLAEVFALEDRLADALETLTETERDVIVGYYMRDKSHARLAREMNYSERNIKYIKARAIVKITRKL